MSAWTLTRQDRTGRNRTVRKGQAGNRTCLERTVTGMPDRTVTGQGGTGHAEQDGKRIGGTRTVTQLDKIREKGLKSMADQDNTNATK
jgi:hypothetical protein